MGGLLSVETGMLDEKTLLVRARGEFAGMEVLESEARILGAMEKEKRPRVVIDLKDVSYIDSAGIGVLYKCAKKAGELRLQLALMRPTEDVKKILKTAAVHKVIEIFE